MIIQATITFPYTLVKIYSNPARKVKSAFVNTIITSFTMKQCVFCWVIKDPISKLYPLRN